MAALASMRRQAGFTLLEMLAVITIIAVLGGMAMMSVSGQAQRRGREEAQHLQQALQLAADEAVLGESEMAAYFTANGYGFLRYDTAAQRWRMLNEQAFRAHALPADVHLSLSVEQTPLPLAGASGDQAPRPALLFLSTGEMTPFSLSLSAGDTAYTLAADGLAAITLKPGATP